MTDFPEHLFSVEGASKTLCAECGPRFSVEYVWQLLSTGHLKSKVLCKVFAARKNQCLEVVDWFSVKPEAIKRLLERPSSLTPFLEVCDLDISHRPEIKDAIDSQLLEPRRSLVKTLKDIQVTESSLAEIAKSWKQENPPQRESTSGKMTTQKQDRRGDKSNLHIAILQAGLSEINRAIKANEFASLMHQAGKYKGYLNASALAQRISDNRHRYESLEPKDGGPDDPYGTTLDTIIEKIRQAIKL